MVYCLLVLVAARRRSGAFAAACARLFEVAAIEFAPATVSILKPVKGFDQECMRLSQPLPAGLRGRIRADLRSRQRGRSGGRSSPPSDGRVSRSADSAGDLPGAAGNQRQGLEPDPDAAAATRHEFLLINDSDIRVSPRYLERVMRQFAAPGKKPVGMVTALYRGQAHLEPRTADARLARSAGIATDFQAGV
jgi:hypothetical protein